MAATGATPACAKARLARSRWPEKHTERDIGVARERLEKDQPGDQGNQQIHQDHGNASISNSAMASTIRTGVVEMNQKRLKAGWIVNVARWC